MSTIVDCSFLTQDGYFYKGNLHCHSTASDGKKSYQELIEGYHNKGYSFLAFSDHEVFNDVSTLERSDFKLLPTVEWATNHVENETWLQTHHIHGIQGTAVMVDGSVLGPLSPGTQLPRLQWQGESTVQQMHNYLHSYGHLSIYNHPVWSRTTPQDFGSLAGFDALEIYNYGCDLENHTGYADIYWDQLLSRGMHINAVATDDNHNANGWGDSFGGWITVKAPSLTREGILTAIAQGSYYSSTGPQIYEYGVNNGIAYMSCSPCHHVNFVAGGYVGAGLSVWSNDTQDSLSYAEYKLGKGTSYLRVECVDKNGCIAWSNPIYAE